MGAEEAGAACYQGGGHAVDDTYGPERHPTLLRTSYPRSRDLEAAISPKRGIADVPGRGHAAPMASLRLGFITCLTVLALAVVPTAGAITNGSPDGDDHPYVVAVGQILPNGGRGAFCSGTLVSPTVVLTAAHCGLLSPTSAPSGQTFLVFRASVFNTVAPVRAPSRPIRGSAWPVREHPRASARTTSP